MAAADSTTTEGGRKRVTRKSAAAPPQQAQELPVVLVSKKKERRYSKGLKDIQRLERGLTRASQRVSGAVADGISTYRRKSNKSSRKKRDGAIRDAVVNWSDGFSKMARRASRAPNDIAKQLNTKRMWRRTRPLVRAATAPLNLFLR